MTKEEFNSKRQEIYQQMVREAYAKIKAKGDCGRGRIVASAKAVATRKFFKLEAEVYAE